MDKTPGSDPGNSIVVTGFGCEVSDDVLSYLTQGRPRIEKVQLFHDCKPLEFLRHRKTLKFMSKQDRLAVKAAGKALNDSSPDKEDRKEGCGLFITVGYIPFHREDAHNICAHAQQEGRFSMEMFSTEAFDKINPILAFSCLPNMPAHHLSANFDLQGEYFITYPGAPQFYQALEEAVACLQEGDMSWALAGGVADQCNFLVENHFEKQCPEKAVRAADAAAFVVLERETHAVGRGKKPRARLVSLELNHLPETTEAVNKRNGLDLGPVDLPMRLLLAAQESDAIFEHACETGRHIFKSCWEII